MDQLVQFVIEFLARFPVVHSIVAIVGALRLIVKPIVSAARAVAAMTPSKGDDEFLASVETSRGYKIIAFVLDWLASIKLPGTK